jgi:hypothetical protein
MKRLVKISGLFTPSPMFGGEPLEQAIFSALPEFAYPVSQD